MDYIAYIQMIGQQIWIYGGSFILILSILVFVHEWGHYIVARMCGIRVEQFSIGFGKEIYGFNDRAGTRWKLSLIPLGGFVQLFGDTDPASAGHTDKIEEESGDVREMTEEELNVAFFNKKLWQRALVVFAGPAINYLFAIALLAGIYFYYGQPVSPPTAAAIVQGSSAETYGFEPHDYILSIDGKTISDFHDIRREMMVALDEERNFVVKRGDETIEISARPKKIMITDRFGFSNSIGVLGIVSADRGILLDSIQSIDGVEYDNAQQVVEEITRRMGTTFSIGFKPAPVPDSSEAEETAGGTQEEAGERDTQSAPSEREQDVLIVSPQANMNEDLGSAATPGENVLYLADLPAAQFVPHTLMTALQSAINESYIITVSSFEALWQMVVGVRSVTELGGVVRIGAITGDTAMRGLVPLVLFTALLSINLGFINLLPIPMLDGGHLLFYGVEGIIGRSVPEYVQEYAFRAGFVFLIGLMAFANLNDIYQLIT
ncbi:MAG: M50 family metallopeptidase [Alphaproteobacteria bacterium]